MAAGAPLQQDVVGQVDEVQLALVRRLREQRLRQARGHAARVRRARQEPVATRPDGLLRAAGRCPAGEACSLHLFAGLTCKSPFK